MKETNGKNSVKSSKNAKNDCEKPLETKILDFSYSDGGRQKIIQITSHDMKYLEAEDYLNDTIINFFLK